MVTLFRDLPWTPDIRVTHSCQDLAGHEAWSLAWMEFHTCLVNGQLNKRWSWLSPPWQKPHWGEMFKPNDTSLSAVDSLFWMASQVTKLHFGMWAENQTTLCHTTLGKEVRNLSHRDAIVNCPLEFRVHLVWSVSFNLAWTRGGRVFLTSFSSNVWVMGTPNLSYWWCEKQKHFVVYQHHTQFEDQIYLLKDRGGASCHATST